MLNINAFFFCYSLNVQHEGFYSSQRHSLHRKLQTLLHGSTCAISVHLCTILFGSHDLFLIKEIAVVPFHKRNLERCAKLLVEVAFLC